MAEAVITPLTGKALLQKLKDKDVDALSRRDKAKLCGYYTLSKKGEVQVNMTEFYAAVVEAKGIQLDSPAKREGRGREASGMVTVHSNYQIVIGAAYVKEMGLKPGDRFFVKLGNKNITLAPVTDEDDDHEHGDDHEHDRKK